MAGSASVASVERFHLAFLTVLGKRVQPGRFALKGGANLRYFFDSVRYSVDVDIDADAALHRSLRPKVDAILGGAPLALLLRTAGMEVGDVTAPKQTATTRRWKVELRREGLREPVRTKIEFSSRADTHDAVVEAVPRRVVAPYGLVPPTIPHYPAPHALAQKVRALAGRTETQARDVFDLDLLLRTHDTPRDLVTEAERVRAAERATALPEAAYRDQVLAFLDADAVELYRDEWNVMVARVVDALLEVAP